MKKFLVLPLIISITALVAIADDARFARALKTCSSYSQSGNVNTEGLDITSTKKILGWQGDRCVYQEKVQFSGMDTTITCRFTNSQINELSSVMEAYALVQQYSNENIDTSSVSAVQNNPVVKAWNKYLQDTSVCAMNSVQDEW